MLRLLPKTSWLVLALIAGPAFAQDKVAPPVVDPTENVKSLQAAGDKRQDDLRALDSKIGELRDAHLKEIMALRADYETQLRVAEAKRIDAIRLVDTTAVAVQNERAVATATTLAKTVQDSAQVLSVQVTKSADDLRTLVATTAAESSRSLQQQFAAITTRLSALEQGSVNTSGVGAGRSDVVGWIVAGLMMLIALAAVLVPAFRTKQTARR
jgi:hypothetical protein